MFIRKITILLAIIFVFLIPTRLMALYGNDNMNFKSQDNNHDFSLDINSRDNVFIDKFDTGPSAKTQANFVVTESLMTDISSDEFYDEYDDCKTPPEKTTFYDTDTRAALWFHYENANAGDTNKREWYSPDGNLYAQGSGTYPYNNGCWLVSINIKGASAASKLGEWQVKVYQNDQLLFTKTFTIKTLDNFVITESLMTDISSDEFYDEYDDCKTPPEKTTFYDTDTRAALWFHYENANAEDTNKREWYSPDGNLYAQGSETYPYNNGCGLGSINIKGASAASKLGEWQVKVYRNNEHKFTETFTIVSDPFITPTPSPTPTTTSTPITGHSAALSVSQSEVSLYDSVVVTVVDRDLNTSSSYADTGRVKIKSNSDTTGFTLGLYETNVNSGTFQSTFMTADTTSYTKPAKIAVVAGDTITVSYVDDLTATGNSATITSTVSVKGTTGTPTPGVTPTPTGVGDIAGVVVSAALATPVAGVTVSTDTGGFTATTGADGTYTISNVTPGDYTLTASATGFVSSSQSVTVTAGVTTTANFDLSSATATPTPVVTPTPTVSPTPTTTPEEEKLLEKYAPILYMHPDEQFHPTDVQTMIDNSKLYEKKKNKKGKYTEGKPVDLKGKILSLELLMNTKYNSEEYYLMLKNDAKEAIENNLVYWNWKKDQTVYGRKFEDAKKTVLQYWFFYVYNDWGGLKEGGNKHEGDWEMIQIILGNNTQPSEITYSFHHGGQTFLWSDKEVIKSKDGNHPLVYVTLGGHGSWNKPGSHAWYQEPKICLDCNDETREDGDVLYPDTMSNSEIETNAKKYSYAIEDMTDWTEKNKDWIYWKGYWGSQTKKKIKNKTDYDIYGYTSGPPSPPYIDYIDDGIEGRWKKPVFWEAFPNPSDYEICASSNIKVIAHDMKGNIVNLLDNCSIDSLCGGCSTIKILYSEKDLVFDVYSLEGKEVDLKISRYKKTGEVCEVEFDWLKIPKNGKATLRFSPDENPNLEMEIDHDHNGIFDYRVSPDYVEFR